MGRNNLRFKRDLHFELVTQQLRIYIVVKEENTNNGAFEPGTTEIP